MGVKPVNIVFQQYQVARAEFAQNIVDLANRPEMIEQLMHENSLPLLGNLLRDPAAGVQINAVTAIGKLANHSAVVAEMILKQDIRYLKRAALTTLKLIVKHSVDLCKSFIELGGLDQVVGALEEFDAGVKEAAANILASMARLDVSLATQVVSAGAVPILTLSLQEPEVNVRVAAASAVNEIVKHSLEMAQQFIDAGAVAHLVRIAKSTEAKLKRQSMNTLAALTKHSIEITEMIIESDVFPIMFELASHCDESVRKATCSLIKEIVKHSEALAGMAVEAGCLGVLINCIVKNKGENRIPAIMALGYIAGHSPGLSTSVIYSKGVDALALSLEDKCNPQVGAAAAWALGHIGRHSSEHARNVTSSGLLLKILKIYENSEYPGTKDKAQQALKMLLLKADDVESIEPLLIVAPLQIVKYVVALYSKILEQQPQARRSFVSSGGLQKCQMLLAEHAPEGSVLREDILAINGYFPQDVINYFSPDFAENMLDRIDEFQPPMNIDPATWTDRRFTPENDPGSSGESIDGMQRKEIKIRGKGYSSPKVAKMKKSSNV